MTERLSRRQKAHWTNDYQRLMTGSATAAAAAAAGMKVGRSVNQ